MQLGNLSRKVGISCLLILLSSPISCLTGSGKTGVSTAPTIGASLQSISIYSAALDSGRAHTLFLPGGTPMQLQAYGLFSDGSTQSLTTSVTWSSSNVSKCTMSNTAGSQGQATAVAAGTCAVVVTFGSISQSRNITVDDLLAGGAAED